MYRQDISIYHTSAYTEHMHTSSTPIIGDMLNISLFPERKNMRTVSIFKNGNNRAIRLPRDMDFEGVSEQEKANPDFMAEREDVVTDEGRFEL